MSNDTLLETIEKQIAEMEGKLQKELKSQPQANLVNEDMREYLKQLHEKRREILNRKSQE
jgi:hypothetical protein